MPWKCGFKQLRRLGSQIRDSVNVQLTRESASFGEERVKARRSAPPSGIESAEEWTWHDLRKLPSPGGLPGYPTFLTVEGSPCCWLRLPWRSFYRR